MTYNNRRNNRPRVPILQSSGPDVVVRGTPHQIVSKYEELAVEADNKKDRVLAERYRQHAEHYKKEIK